MHLDAAAASLMRAFEVYRSERRTTLIPPPPRACTARTPDYRYIIPTFMYYAAFRVRY